MKATVEYKFKPYDKAIAQVEYSFIPVKVLKLEGFENYSGTFIPKYRVEQLSYDRKDFVVFETDLYSKESLMEVLDLYLKE